MSVYEKNGKWFYEFMQKGERGHGRCYGCTERKQAAEFENDMKYELSLIQRGKVKVERKFTFNDMMNFYMSYSEANKKSSFKDITYIKYLNEFFGRSTDVSIIKPRDIENFKAYMTKDLKRSNATFNRYFSALKKAYNVLLDNDDDITFKNPCRKVKKLKEDNKKEAYLTEEMEKALLQELAIHLRPIVICALQTGLRKSNILNLMWENVDLEMGFIEVLKQENKGHKKIQIPISPKLEELLYDLIVERYIAPLLVMQNGFNLKFIVYNSYVFINPHTGERCKEIKTGFNKAVERAKIDNFTFHDLRHTVGTRLGNSGTDVRVIQEILAHSDISTTMRYMHATPESKVKAIAVLNSF